MYTMLHHSLSQKTLILIHCNCNKSHMTRQATLCSVLYRWVATYINPLMPNDPYRGRTTPLTSKRCILYIYSTNIGTEYFKHDIYSPFFPLQNAVCFVILTYLFPVLFAFYIQDVLKLEINSGAKRLITTEELMRLFSVELCKNTIHFPKTVILGK